jgi:adenosylcobinamide-phosphate synthase
MRAQRAPWAQRTYARGVFAGYLGDLLLGDPRRGHPVAAFGQAAAVAERALWRDRRRAGAGYAALCVAGALLTVAGLSRAARGGAGETVGGTAFDAAVTWTVLGGTGLVREAQAVAEALDAGELADARRRLPHLCGRDPEALEADGIARAVVESVAENTSDAVVGALVWGAIAGAPGMAAFRAVNTLDAMVGHRSEHHQRFGWAAARLDDIANWVPARVTALLVLALAPGRRRPTWRAAMVDGACHPSPNAGRAEGAFAGALGRRLGGVNRYAHGTERRPHLGDGGAPQPHDIERAVRLARRVGLAAAALAAIGARA